MIKNIIFDLGDVLVHVLFKEKFKKNILACGVSEKTFNKVYGNFKLRDALEEGKITFDEYYRIVDRNFNVHIPKAQFIRIYNDMFSEMEGMPQLIRILSKLKKYKLFLLSNTSKVHFDHFIKKEYSYINYITTFILSYKLKLIKPNPAIFKTALKKYKMKPEETLFIDDLHDNCKSAESVGIKTIQFKGYKSFIKQFNKLIKY